MKNSKFEIRNIWRPKRPFIWTLRCWGTTAQDEISEIRNSKYLARSALIHSDLVPFQLSPAASAIFPNRKSKIENQKSP